MNFDTSEEQQLLADSVRRFLQNEYGFEARKASLARPAPDEAVWGSLADMGILGLPLPAEHGGFGGGAVDLMGVMEAFGDALLAEPVVPALLAARLVAKGGSAAQQAALLPGFAEGRLRLALAHDERGARYRADRIACRFEGGTLRGEKHAVVGAPGAHRLVVSARTESGIGLFLSAAPAAEPVRTVDGQLAADLKFDGTPAEPLAGGLEALEEALDYGAALACAEAVGAMKYACDATLEYLKTRKQFGLPIGAFQALQHRMVDMVIAQEQARSMACLASSKVDTAENAAERARAVSAAKVKVSDAARHVSQESVQLHGGMGMTEEMKVSHTFRRLTVLARLFGDADFHLARFASL